jgi:hypothetical protein
MSRLLEAFPAIQDFREEKAIDPATGFVLMEQWRKNDKFHRIDGPASITRDPSTGVVTEEYWMQSDHLDRDDGPAMILRDAATASSYLRSGIRKGVITASVDQHRFGAMSRQV